MPVREIKTTIALDGEQQFKKALADATREMRVMDSELKAVSEAYKVNGDGAEYFAAKQRNLRSQISQQENIIKSLEQAVEEAGKAYGESSSQVDGYTIKLNNARAKMSQLEKQLSETDREIEELGRDSVKAGRQIEQGIGESSQEAEKDVRGLVETLQDDLSAIRSNTTFTAIGSLWDMAAGAYQAVAGFVDGTAEYRRQLSFLEQNAETAGLDFSVIKDQLTEVQGVTGDASAAIEGLSNLLAAGFDEHRLAEAVDLLAGAIVNFPETMKFESLADSLQETLATGEATGQFAELLGRLGVDLNDFNAALEESPTAAGDMDIALAYLASGGMKQVYDQWQKNNEAMVEAGETQAELERELAEFGGTLEEYIVTPVKRQVVDAFKWVNEYLQQWDQQNDVVKAIHKQTISEVNAGTMTQDEADQVVMGTKIWVYGNRALNLHNSMPYSGVLHAISDGQAKQDQLINPDAAWSESVMRWTTNMKETIMELLFPTAGAEEAGADAANAYYAGFADQITVNEAEAEQATPVKVAGLPTEGDMEEIIRSIDAELQNAQPELEEAGEEAGDAMSGGFEKAWEALETKAYQAGVSTGAAYAEGLNSQLGAISTAAARLSAAASAGLERAGRLARLGITLNLDGRKVAEGIAPYSDEVMATYLNFD